MRRHLIAVSIGNSSIQLGQPSTSTQPWQWSNRFDVPTADFDPVACENYLPGDPAYWYVSSVHRPSEAKLASWVQAARPRDQYQLLTAAQLPLQIRVERPQAVGMDRLLAAVGANLLRAAVCPAVIVDAGTAITVDLVGSDGAFLGGSILPGLAIAARALARETDLLPQVSTQFRTKPPVVGKDTQAAISSGILWGAVGAIRELVTRMSRALDSEPQLFATGGDAGKLVPHLGPAYQLVPELVLSGIVAAVEDAHSS